MTFADDCRELMTLSKEVNQAMKRLQKLGIVKPLIEQEGEDFFKGFWLGENVNDEVAQVLYNLLIEERLARAKDEVAFLCSMDMIIDEPRNIDTMEPIVKRVLDLKEGISILEGRKA